MKEHIRWYLLILLLNLSHCQEKWVHICYRETKEVSCQEDDIIEVTGIYKGYRESGCPGDSTDPVCVIAYCYERDFHEDALKTNIAKACNQTKACNISSFAVGAGVRIRCPQDQRYSSNFQSYSYICTPRPSTPAPLTTPRPVTQSPVTVSKPTCHSSGYIAAAVIGGMLIGSVLGVTGMLCLSVHRGIPYSLVNCVRCRCGRKEESSQNNDLQTNTKLEERTDDYNVNNPNQSHQACPHSGVNISDPNQDGTYEDIPEDINLEDVKVYSELQSNDYVNGPDSTVYEDLKPQRS